MWHFGWPRSRVTLALRLRPAFNPLLRPLPVPLFALLPPVETNGRFWEKHIAPRRSVQTQMIVVGPAGQFDAHRPYSKLAAPAPEAAFLSCSAAH